MEDIIHQINARGFQVNNLFQIGDNYWRCNIRDSSGGFFAFANAPTAKEALAGALEKTESGPTNAKKADDFADILG